MASTGPVPAPSRIAAIVAALIALAAVAGAVFFPANVGVFVAVALVAGAYSVMTFRALPRKPRKKKKRGASPFIVMVPKEDDEMFSVLDSLGIPVDGSGGNAKAAIYRGYKLLTSGRANEGVDALRNVTSSLDDTADPAMRRVAAVAHYLIGKAHEAAGNRGAAMTEFNHCIRLAPDYMMQRSGDGREIEH
jgi:hypothetical protein